MISMPGQTFVAPLPAAFERRI